MSSHQRGGGGGGGGGGGRCTELSVKKFINNFMLEHCTVCEQASEKGRGQEFQSKMDLTNNGNITVT